MGKDTKLLALGYGNLYKSVLYSIFSLASAKTERYSHMAVN